MIKLLERGKMLLVGGLQSIYIYSIILSSSKQTTTKLFALVVLIEMIQEQTKWFPSKQYSIYSIYSILHYFYLFLPTT
jgi:hypothetical protein